MKAFKKLLGGVAALSLALSFVGPVQPASAANAVTLGAADSFAVLGGSGITFTAPSSTVNGDIGTFPTTTITGIGNVVLTGINHAGDAVTQLAKTDLVTAYNDAGQPNAGTNAGVIAADLGGQTLIPGVYEDNNAPDSLSITGTLTLDAQGDPNAVFIFKSGSTLTTAAGSSVVFLGGVGQACNVFWQIGSSATFGVGSTFLGNVIAMASITDDGGSTINGRFLARNALVTLNNTTLTRATCAPTPVPGGSGASTITVVKTVINDNGRTATTADFSLFVGGTPVVSGFTNAFQPNPTILVTESANANYTRTFSGDCDINGQIDLSPGSSKFCFITNNDIGAQIVVPPVPPIIDVVKVPTPLALPAGPGSVLYTYTTRNIGTVPMTNVTMVGDTCSPIVLASGDTNNNSILEVNETWVYTCTTNLTATHTNTVVATGWANGISAVDIASATVVVGLPIVPPLIHITKVPSPLTLGVGGGLVTYTKTVTNPGTVALSNVQVTDNKCSPLTYVSGDTNSNSLLETSETWIYRCTTNLTATTTNTAVATGVANGLTARDFAVATVVVPTAVPALPNTGFAPAGKVVAGGAVAVSLILYAGYAIRKRQKVSGR